MIDLPLSAHRWMARQIVTCEAKRVFRSRHDALVYAGHRQLALHPYRCDVCGDWHLSSSPHNPAAAKPVPAGPTPARDSVGEGL